MIHALFSGIFAEDFYMLYKFNIYPVPNEKIFEEQPAVWSRDQNSHYPQAGKVLPLGDSGSLF